MRRWLRGYEYSYGDAVRGQPPVVRQGRGLPSPYASFLDLVDLLFFTDGGAIFLRLKEGAKKGRGDAILELMSGGQWVIATVIRQLAQQIEFGSPEGLASRWHPLRRDRPVVLDPKVSFGAPSIAGRGVKTINVNDLYMAEGESLESVRTSWGLTDTEIQAAVDFERQLAA